MSPTVWCVQCEHPNPAGVDQCRWCRSLNLTPYREDIPVLQGESAEYAAACAWTDRKDRWT